MTFAKLTVIAVEGFLICAIVGAPFSIWLSHSTCLWGFIFQWVRIPVSERDILPIWPTPDLSEQADPQCRIIEFINPFVEFFWSDLWDSTDQVSVMFSAVALSLKPVLWFMNYKVFLLPCFCENEKTHFTSFDEHYLTSFFRLMKVFSIIM